MYEIGRKIIQGLRPLVGITLRWILHELLEIPSATEPKLLTVATAHQHYLNWLFLAVSHSLTLLLMFPVISKYPPGFRVCCWGSPNQIHTLRPRKESFLSRASCFLGPLCLLCHCLPAHARSTWAHWGRPIGNQPHPSFQFMWCHHSQSKLLDPIFRACTGLFTLTVLSSEHSWNWSLRCGYQGEETKINYMGWGIHKFVHETPYGTRCWRWRKGENRVGTWPEPSYFVLSYSCAKL